MNKNKIQYNIIKYKILMQQTPNPSAQLPSSVPPFASHSELFIKRRINNIKTR